MQIQSAIQFLLQILPVKILLQDPATGRLTRSYVADGVELPEIHLSPALHAYARALGRDVRGQLCALDTPVELAPLIILTKQDNKRLFPHDPIVVLEINLMTGHPKTHNFTHWFEGTRGGDISAVYLSRTMVKTTRWQPARARKTTKNCVFVTICYASSRRCWLMSILSTLATASPTSTESNIIV